MRLPGLLERQAPARRLIILAIACSILFSPFLWTLGHFALGSQLYSYLLLIPFVCAYLFNTVATPLESREPAVAQASALLVVEGLLLLAWLGGRPEDPQAGLALGALCLVVAIWICALLSLGWQGCRQRLFPLVFLLLIAPLPTSMEAGLETLLQHGSAEVADLLFHVSGLTYFRDELSFQLPGIRLLIAPECSGIHSSIVLFVVSLVAGFLFLSSAWKRALLTVLVLPLALLRNGFRVWVLGELCVHIDPSMIDSPIHHHGGPIFFAISLVPFLWLLYLLRKSEQQGTARTPSA
jgi:exosortase C (VPDSG-CTERM-specific)